MSSILPAIFVLGVLIFFHELGHFLMAKKAGIRVEKFSLGFPPTILKKKYGDTEYCIGLIPLGGYVKMAGETPGEEITGAPDEFMSKSVGARALVVAAGPFMNVLIAFLVLWGVFWVRGEEVVDTDHAVIGIVSPDSPASKAGLEPGDIVTSINGEAVTTFRSMYEHIRTEVEKPITLGWQRNGQDMSATVTTSFSEFLNQDGVKDTVGIIGVGQQTTFIDLSFFTAAKRGAQKTYEFAATVYNFVYDLIRLQVSPKLIGGPVFIMQMAGETAQMGFATLLAFMSLLSVNLAILNILPIPILDGGHLIFLLIEKIKGSPVSLNARIISQQIGLVFLLIVIIMVTYQDIMRVITG